MSEVYLVILEDRHTDVEVRVFADRQDAIDHAEQIVEDYDYDDDKPALGNPPDGWLFHAVLSCEGDSVRVEKAEVK